ncbi:UNVERIFIED_ORG: fructoselysine and glucoselysine-specific PTS system IID component [Heyndrickxia coagulans]
MIKTAEKPLIGNKELRSMFWRSFLIQSSWSFDKMMAYGQMFAIEKSLRKIYPNNDDYYTALKRHCETFNITPHISPFVMGISVALEEENAKNENFDDSSINKIKVGLMGPLSGIGDSFFWGTFRIIAAGIGIAFAKHGNYIGCLLYFLLYTGIHFICKWLSAKYGYRLGTKFLSDSEENHMIEKLSHGASILGLTVIGAMIGTMVTLSTKLVMNFSGTQTKLQEIFDNIFPGILPLAATFVCVWLFNKNIKTIYIILGIFAVSIIGKYLGIF